MKKFKTTEVVPKPQAKNSSVNEELHATATDGNRLRLCFSSPPSQPSPLVIWFLFLLLLLKFWRCWWGIRERGRQGGCSPGVPGRYPMPWPKGSP